MLADTSVPTEAGPEQGLCSNIFLDCNCDFYWLSFVGHAFKCRFAKTAKTSHAAEVIRT